MRLKGKLFSIFILMMNLYYLSSCAAKANLLTTSFDVSRNISTISYDNYEPSLHVIENKEDLTNFFGIYPYNLGDNFYTDIEYFETNFGFENYLVVYFEQIISVECTINAYINEIENDSMIIVFTYNYPKSDTYLTADVYYQGFYLIEKSSFKDINMIITFKIGEKVLCTEYYQGAEL